MERSTKHNIQYLGPFVITKNYFRYLSSNYIKGEGAKLATVNFQMDNFGTPKLDGAKPYIVNKNKTNLASPLT